MGSQHCNIDGKKIYSIDMMIAYIDIFSPEYEKINMNTMESYLNEKVWYDSEKKIYYSPKDLLNHPKKDTDKFLQRHMKRITNSNLKFPISIYKNNIIDGYNRLTKSYLLNKKTIKVFNFNDKIMNNFVVDTKKDYDHVNNLRLYEYIKLFVKNFKLESKNTLKLC